jgi:hypothetical protein
MRHDWSPRTFQIGIVASLAVLLLQLGDVPVLETINPLSVTGCATPKMLFIRPPTGSHVSADVDESPLTLVHEEGHAVTIPASFDHPIMVLDKDGKRYGPLLLQGIDRHRERLCGWTPSGTTECVPVAGIRGIYVINQGNLQRERRKGLLAGALGGAAVGLAIPLTVALSTEGGPAQLDALPIVLCFSAVTMPVGAGIGAGVGAGVGEMVGRSRDNTESYLIDPSEWRFQSPSSDPAKGE